MFTGSIGVVELLKTGETAGTGDKVYIEGGNLMDVAYGGTNHITISTTAELNENSFRGITIYPSDSTVAHNPLTTGNNVEYVMASSTTDDLHMWSGAGIDISATSGTNQIVYSLLTDQAGVIRKAGYDSTSYWNMPSDNEYQIVFGNEIDFLFMSNGNFHADGNITAYSSTTTSDAKLKENIEKVDGALELVSQLNGVTFNWKRDGKESAGVIAQNVEEVLPSAVSEVEELNGDDTHKVVDYNQLSALFIEAIKELKEENKQLKAAIEELKNINNK